MGSVSFPFCSPLIRLTDCSYLKSPIITVKVGSPTEKFFLHRELLIRESEKMLKELNGEFKEAKTLEIDLSDEESLLFAHFAKYLYSEQPLDVLPDPSRTGTGQTGHVSDYVLLARLYAMGERLWAPKFQDAVLRNFTRNFTSDTVMADQQICELLKIACEEIAERSNDDDAMRKHIFWYASTRLSQLQLCPYFFEVLLHEYGEVGRQMAVRAGKPENLQPATPQGTLEVHFKDERRSTY